MARHIILNNGSFFRVASTDEVKDFWENNGFTSTSCTEDEFDGLKRATKFYDGSSVVDTDPSGEVTFDINELQVALDKHINDCKHILANHQTPPSTWSSDLTSLEAIDVGSIDDGQPTDTMPTYTGKNFVDALAKNGITVSLVLEM